MTEKGYGGYPDLTSTDRALVIALRNIGDVVLTTPVYRELRKALPEGAAIDAMVRSGTEEVLGNNPNINDIIVVPSKRGIGSELALLRRVRAGGYGLIVVLTTGERGETLASLSGASVTAGAPPTKRSLLTKNFPTHAVLHASRGRHQVERNLDCLRRIGVFPDKGSRHTELFDDPDAAARVKVLLTEAGIKDGEKYLAVHPTSRWMFKCWPAKSAAALIDRVSGELGTKVVVTSGPGEAEALYIKDMLGALTSNVIDLTARLDLMELTPLLRGAAAFFGVDSAPMHMAASVNTPTVALFGPSIAVDWKPTGKSDIVITSDDYTCLPCGRDGCGGSKVSECLVDIEVSTVFDAVKMRLGSG